MNSRFSYNPVGYIKNFASLRVACLWAGGLGLIQSLLFVCLTVTGILAYSCIIDIKGTFNYGSVIPIVFMQLYFMGTCGSDTIPAYNDTVLQQVETVLSPQDILVWDCLYLAVTVCWFFTSILLITSLKPDQPSLVSGLLWAWSLITGIICMMDLALGVIFGIDYSRFNQQAYLYNLDNIYAGDLTPEAAQLLAGMVASMSMLIISLKGFILWIVNAGFLIYLSMRALLIAQDKTGTSTFFMPRKESDSIAADRPPINAYQEEQKPSVIPAVYANGGFEPESQAQENVAVINREIIARAARLSADVSLLERRFRNLDNFQQYPPPSRPESTIPEHAEQQQPATTPIVVTDFPAPDYTPPMQRAAQNPNRNQRFQ